MARVPATAARRFPAGGWAWLAPLVAAAGILLGHTELARLDAGLLAAGFIAVAYMKPRWFLFAIPVVYPFQLFALSFAYKAGLGATTVRYLGYWIEVAAVGLALRAGRNHLRRRLDAIDWTALTYVAVVGMYRLAPTLFVAAGPTGPPTAGTILNTALRNDVFFVVMFLIARHLGISEADRRRFAFITFTVGVVVALTGAYEYLASSSWNHFVVHTLGVTRYQAEVLKTPVHNMHDIRVYTLTAGHKLLRIGSIFIDQLQCAFFLVGCLAIGCEYLAGNGRRRALVTAGTFLVAAALVLTQTRDAILAGAVVAVMVLRPMPHRDRLRRVQLSLLAGLTILLLLPVALAVGLGTRATAAINGQDHSTKVHLAALGKGTSALLHHPLGRGLGTGGTNGTRFDVASTLTSEDQYLQVGNETGVFSLIPFLGLTVAVTVRLRRAARERGSLTAGAWSGAFAGLALAGLLLQVWLSLITAVIVWSAVGMDLSPDPQPGSLPFGAVPESDEAGGTPGLARVGG